ncbi:DUF3558 domain-containing protein [Nocardia halotolerans]|uniref:DUF3558 domain-containing protein n=1 Tax=Nocardia halotolerans TaxID=1755878 RepID=A0ABV8VN86_9NOCA
MERAAVARILVVGGAISTFLGGCSAGSQGEAQPSSSATSTAEESVLPTGFDGCALPQFVIDAEELKNPEKDDGWTAGRNKWLGCGWIQPRGYGATITVSTISVEQVRTNTEHVVGEELEISGRAAITSYPSAQAGKWCTTNVEMKNGSMEIAINVQPKPERSVGRHPCDISKDLASMLAPTIQSGS